MLTSVCFTNKEAWILKIAQQNCKTNKCGRPYSQHIGWPQPLHLPTENKKISYSTTYFYYVLTTLVAGASCTRAVMTRTSFHYQTIYVFTAQYRSSRHPLLYSRFRRLSMQSAACRRRHRHNTHTHYTLSVHRSPLFADLLHVMTGDVIGFET